MIRLVVEPYCRNCPYFDPEVDRAEIIRLTNEDPLTGEIKTLRKTQGDTLVYCKERRKCEEIFTYIKNEEAL